MGGALGWLGNVLSSRKRFRKLEEFKGKHEVRVAVIEQLIPSLTGEAPRASGRWKFDSHAGVIVFNSTPEPMVVRVHNAMTVMTDVGDWLRRHGLEEPLPDAAYDYEPQLEEGQESWLEDLDRKTGDPAPQED